MITGEVNESKNGETFKESGAVSITFDAGKNLAHVLQSIEDEERRFAELRTEHKDTMERLHNLAYKMRREILTGQHALPLESA